MSGRRFRFASLAAALLAIGGGQQAALAKGGDFYGVGDGDSVLLTGGNNWSSRSGSDSGSTTSGGPVATTITVVMMVPACLGNEPSGTNRGNGAGCGQAAANCATTPDPQDIQYWTYRGTAPLTNPTDLTWTRTAVACYRPQDITTTTPTPVLTIQDIRRLPIPPATLHIQPNAPTALINIPTNIYAHATDHTLTTTVLATPIRVKVHPTSYHYTYGDHTTLDTTDPGGPYPTLTTAHTYQHPGPHTITLTTSYTAEYALPGQPFQPVTGTVEVPSTPVTIEHVQTRAHLVTD